MAITAGILAIVVANALLSPSSSMLATMGCAVAMTVTRHLVFGGLPWWIGLDVLFLYSLILAAVCAGSLQVRRAFEISASGWATSRVLLRELRTRRVELHRVVTAQRESAYRLERMNRELQRARREADEARRTKEQLVATISHELRGPLNLILGYSRVLVLSPETYGAPLPPAYRRDVDVIYRNSQPLSSLIEDVLDLSRVEADSLPLVKDRVHLAEDVVSRVLEAVEPLISRKGLALDLDIEENLPPILGDAVRLRQILTNLVSNAARLTDEGRIGIQAHVDGQRLLVRVSDTGPGIPAQHLARLFTPFLTLRPEDSTTGRGAGLGLSISKRLVELHGGEMWAESKAGEGSVFSFTLPLPDVHLRPSGLMRLDETGLQKHLQDTCVVIGTDPQLLRTLARYMQDLDVVGLPPSKDLSATIETLQPTGIVGSPRHLARLRRELRADPETTPLIALPLAFGAEDAPRLYQKHETVLAYLVKPISEEVLAAAIHSLDLAPDMRILVVDDEPDAVRLMRHLLTAIVPQCQVRAAYSAAGALAQLEEEVPDLVLLDVVMPHVSGQQVIDAMAADPRLAHVPLIVVSARDEPDAERTMHGTIWMHVPHTPITRLADWLNETLKALAHPHAPALEPHRELEEDHQA